MTDDSTLNNIHPYHEEVSSLQPAFNSFAHVKGKKKKKKQRNLNVIFKVISNELPTCSFLFPEVPCHWTETNWFRPMDLSRSYVCLFQAKAARARVRPHPLFPFTATRQACDMTVETAWTWSAALNGNWRQTVAWRVICLQQALCESQVELYWS